MRILRRIGCGSVLVFVALSLVSCFGGTSGLQPSTGKTNEMLVVTNSEIVQKGSVGSSISDFFAQILDGFPQPEKTYDLAFVTEPGFNQMFKTHHNIFIVDINPEFTRPVLETHSDLWARPQRVIKMTVPDDSTFLVEFDLHKEAFMEFFHANERRRAIQAFGTIEDLKIKKFVSEKFDINLMIPKSFYIAKEAKDFVWLRREAQHFSQGILIYTFPYTDTLVFAPDEIIRRRDEFTRSNVPGPAPESFMKVSLIEPPFTRRIDFNGLFAVEMRGMWELEGDFMGGPFINYTVVDEKNGRIITLDGFVYYPNQDKKNLVRQLESLLYTLSIPEKASE